MAKAKALEAELALLREANEKMLRDLDAANVANKEKEAELAAKEVESVDRFNELQRVETLRKEAMEFVEEAKRVAERKEAERLRMEEEKRDAENRLAAEVEARRSADAQQLELNQKAQEEFVELKRKEEAYAVLQAQVQKNRSFGIGKLRRPAIA